VPGLRAARSVTRRPAGVGAVTGVLSILGGVFGAAQLGSHQP